MSPSLLIQTPSSGPVPFKVADPIALLKNPPLNATPLSHYNATYHTEILVSGNWVPNPDILVVDAPTVTYQGKTLNNVNWADDTCTLTASTSDGNDWNISILFLTFNPPFPANATPSPHFYGSRSEAGSTPDKNFMGQVADFFVTDVAKPAAQHDTDHTSSLPANPPIPSTPLSQYDATYHTEILVSGNWVPNADILVVNAPTVTYQGKTLNNVSWADDTCTLTASTTDGNDWNISIMFLTLVPPAAAKPTPTVHFFGSRSVTGSTPDKNFMGQVADLSVANTAAPAAGASPTAQTNLDDMGNILLVKMLEVNMFSLAANHNVPKAPNRVDDLVFKWVQKIKSKVLSQKADAEKGTQTARDAESQIGEKGGQEAADLAAKEAEADATEDTAPIVVENVAADVGPLAEDVALLAL